MELFAVMAGDRITINGDVFYVVSLTKPKAPNTVWTLNLEPVRE